MAALRGRYATRLGALRVVARYGGWARMTAALAQSAGLQAVAPVAGALALVRLPDGQSALGLALAPGQIAVRTEAGFETIDACEVAWLPGGATCRS